jgi:excisionase family DNA binding protein
MPLLNVDQAAECLGTSPRFIRRLIAERRITFTKIGKHIRIDSDDLDAYIKSGRQEAHGAFGGGTVSVKPRPARDR